MIILHARREQFADDLGERQRAVQRPERSFENHVTERLKTGQR